jgi:D-alanine-D-alanine ligase-like ATP-grasp enzyme
MQGSAFLSYARSDRKKAKVIASFLRRCGWEPWWDHYLHAGEQFRRVIEERLSSCSIVIVLWSKDSVDSPWVISEADFARDRHVPLLPVLLDDTPRPLGFGGIQEVDLRNWKGIDRTELDVIRHKLSALLPRRSPERKTSLRVLIVAEPGRNAAEVSDLKKVLVRLRHSVSVTSITDDMLEFRDAVSEWRPDIAIPLIKRTHSGSSEEVVLAGHIQSLRLPHALCSATGLLLSGDLSLARLILHYHRIPCPDSVQIGRNGLQIPKRFRSPLQYRLKHQGAGPSKSFTDMHRLLDAIERLPKAELDSTVVQEAIDGRHFTCAVVGGVSTTVMAPVLKGGKQAFEIDSEMFERLSHLLKRTWRALRLDGHAEIAACLTHDGRVYITDVNTCPELGKTSAFVKSASLAGVTYEKLIAMILRIGIKRAPRSWYESNS